MWLYRKQWHIHADFYEAMSAVKRLQNILP